MTGERLIAVARVRNEDDIVESFVRHHCALADAVIVLDDGSTDRTGEILAALQAEGLPLAVHRSQSATFIESAHNSFLLRKAAEAGADWVLCLDCDEFVDERWLAWPLRDALAEVPPHAAAVAAELTAYHPTSLDNPAEWIVPQRLRHRDQHRSGVFKVFVRGAVALAGGAMEAGNHAVRLNGMALEANPLPGLTLAHFSLRSGWQALAKAVIGRLKVLASGRAEIERNSASHYTDLLGTLRQHPEWLLLDPAFLGGARSPESIGSGAVDDPMDYRGGELRYTHPPDPRMHAAGSILAYVELLASRHGMLLDANPGALAATKTWDGVQS